MSKEAKVSSIPKCDICKDISKREKYHSIKDAQYDGKTSLGPWAFMCQEHYSIYGTGLGTGKGQRLVKE